MPHHPTKLLFASLILLSVWQTPGRAGTLEMAYEVNLGGAQIMAADFTGQSGQGNYSGTFSAKTTGVSKLFSKVRLSLVAKGRVKSGKLVPTRFDYERKKNSKTKTRQLAFDAAGKLVTEGQDYSETLLPSLSGSLFDPISGLFGLTQTDKPCNSKRRIFDGSDVYDISTQPSGGTADRPVCNLIYKPIAGDDVDDGDTESKTYEITFIRGTAEFPFIPISLTGSSKGVPFDVTASAVSIDGAAFSY